MNNKINRGFEVLPEYESQAKNICNKLGLDSFIPQRATNGSAGYDLRAIEDVIIPPGEVKLIGTGLTAYMQLDEELQIRSRSGIAKQKITVINSPGTIDSDYYGKHIMVMLYNQTNESFLIESGERIGQGIFSTYLTTDDDNPVSESRTGGFGSTGTK